GHDLDALALGVGELDAVRALLGGVGAPEVAERAAPAPLHVDWELIRAVPRLLAPLDEEPVVLVDPLGREEVDVVFLHVLARAGGDVGVVETGDVPAADHALRGDDRGAGVDDRRAAVGAAEGEGHGPLGGQEAAVVLVEGAGHVQLGAGELVVAEARSFLEDEDADAVADHGRERLGDGAAAGAGADDDDVGVLLDHASSSSGPAFGVAGAPSAGEPVVASAGPRLASHPRGPARYPLSFAAAGRA